MSEDLRNSIIAWVSVIALSLLAWAFLHFDPLGGVSAAWIWRIVGALWTIRLIFYLVGLWRRRAIRHRLSSGTGTV